tara:strand:+ start:650 stop:949 length:300 start_codon:yes stop_codon:yes gene_type:complete
MNNITEDYITPIKAELEEKMHKFCKWFLNTNNPYGTPRYLNYGSFDYETKVLSIESTSIGIGFNVQTEFDLIESEYFWPQFKTFRTGFLEQHYPNIKTY